MSNDTNNERAIGVKTNIAIMLMKNIITERNYVNKQDESNPGMVNTVNLIANEIASKADPGIKLLLAESALDHNPVLKTFIEDVALDFFFNINYSNQELEEILKYILKISCLVNKISPTELDDAFMNKFSETLMANPKFIVSIFMQLALNVNFDAHTEIALQDAHKEMIELNARL